MPNTTLQRLKDFIARKLEQWEREGQIAAPGGIAASYGPAIDDGGGYGESAPPVPDWLKDEHEWDVYETPPTE